MKEMEMQEVERAVRILITLIERQNLEDEKIEERRRQFKIVGIKKGKNGESRKK